MPKRVNADDKLSYICEKAYEELVHNGVHHFSLNKFIESLNMSKGQFYYYFKTKEDLIAQAIDTKCYEAFHDCYEQAKTHSTFLEKMVAFFALFVGERDDRLIELDRVLKSVFHVYLNVEDGAIKQLNTDFYAQIFSYIDAMIEEMVDKGLIKEEARSLSHSFIATADGMYVHSLMNNDYDMKRYFLDYLTTMDRLLKR